MLKIGLKNQSSHGMVGGTSPMSLQTKILKNTAIQVGGKMIGVFLAFGTSAMLLRYLGPAGNGEYTIILAYLTLFGIVADFGLYIILVKRLATLTPEHEKDAHAIFSLRIICSTLVLGIGALIAWLIPSYTPTIKIGIAIATSFFFLTSLNQLVGTVFQKNLRSDWIAIGEIAAKIVLILATIVVVYYELSLLWMMVGIACSALTNFLLNFFPSRKYFAFHFVVDIPRWKSILKEAWPLALSILFTMMYFKGDALILGFFRSAEEVGWYGAPYKILEVLITFPAMFVGLTLPILTAAWQRNDIAGIQKGIQKSFDFLTLLTVPLIAGAFVLAYPITLLLGGPEYTQSIPILRILIFAVGAIYYATLFTYLVVAVDKQKSMMLGYGAAALLGVTSYLIFIPLYGMYGAASVTVVIETLVLLIAFFLVKKTTHFKLRWAIVPKVCAASVVMASVLWFAIPPLERTLRSFMHAGPAGLRFILTEVGILTSVGAAIYIGIAILLKAVKVQDIKELISIRSQQK